MNQSVKLGLIFFGLWLLFQLVYSSGKYTQYNAQVDKALASVETRIALDLPRLKLANPKFRTVAHHASVSYYLDKLNHTLTEIQAPLRVKQLQSVIIAPQVDGRELTRQLTTVDQSIDLVAVVISPRWWEQITPLALFLAMLVTIMVRHQLRPLDSAQTSGLADIIQPAIPKLIINLHDKNLSNGLDDLPVCLPNKPFCFYAALVDYCLQHPEPYLNHSKEVPEELLILANKYFSRLIELGHTKRKRPDFSTNLDKTLSEIRTALEEVFHNYVEARDMFYPPKAQGEGSRSKVHNYALENLDAGRVEIIGR